MIAALRTIADTNDSEADEERWTEIRAAVAKLPYRDRHLLELHYGNHQYTFSHIGRIFQRTAGTVRTWHNDAISSLCKRAARVNSKTTIK